MFSVLVVVAAGSTILLPVGIDPVSCPNYPYCDGITPVEAPRALELPADVPAAACPDYPNCSSRAAAPIGYTNTAGYPAGVPAAACPSFPYC